MLEIDKSKLVFEIQSSSFTICPDMSNVKTPKFSTFLGYFSVLQSTFIFVKFKKSINTWNMQLWGSKTHVIVDESLNSYFLFVQVPYWFSLKSTVMKSLQPEVPTVCRGQAHLPCLSHPPPRHRVGWMLALTSAQPWRRHLTSRGWS